uniref:ATP synthase F0 subunit 8 n=1 Tax=Aphrophora sp. EMHAU-15062701 TaxID=2042339 RepID=A0A343KJ99_9HEMI|nr:ATP synthase F0 subunit 8 [Aphrophora sp. EMHAU-15062701]
MPQMAPMWWTLLFMFFIFSYLFFNVILFYFYDSKFVFNFNYSNLIVNNMIWVW